MLLVFVQEYMKCIRTARPSLGIRHDTVHETPELEFILFDGTGFREISRVLSTCCTDFDMDVVTRLCGYGRPTGGVR